MLRSLLAFLRNARLSSSPRDYKIEYMDNLRFVKKVGWETVLDAWRENESYKNKWEEYYRSRGYNSWDEWRSGYFIGLGLPIKDWAEYELVDPFPIVPKFRGGPFNTWVKYFYLGEKLPRFSKLAEHPGIRNHRGIRDILENFPKETTVICLSAPEGLVVIEGMHRCAALAVANAEKRKIETTVRIFAAQIPTIHALPNLGGAAKK